MNSFSFQKYFYSKNLKSSSFKNVANFDLFGYGAIFLYVLNPMPIYNNFHISDLFIIVFFSFNFKEIINFTFKSSNYRRLLPFLYLFNLFSLIPGFYASDPIIHLIAVAQFSFVFFIQIPSLLLFIRDKSEKFLQISILGIISAIFILLIFYIFNISFDNIFYYHRGFGARTGISSIMDMGFLIGISIIMGHQLFIRKKINRINFLFLIILSICGLVLTATRSAIGMVFIYFTILALTYPTAKKLRILISSSIILFSLNLLMISSENNPLRGNYERLLTVTKLSTFVKSDRFSQYSTIPDVLSKYPLGVGYNNYQIVYRNTPIHNIFLLILVEGGIIPFILFCSIWIVIIFSILFNNINDKRNLIAIILSYLFYISTVSNIYDRNFWLIVIYVIFMADLRYIIHNNSKKTLSV